MNKVMAEQVVSHIFSRSDVLEDKIYEVRDFQQHTVIAGACMVSSPG